MSHRYLIYPRKSSESEERQELSIPAQIRELDELAKRRGLTIVGTPLEEACSAKAPGRPMFGKLMAELQAGRADGILCWKLDRLARNPKDGGDIMWALAQGVIKEIVTPERSYTGTGDDKMLMSIMFGMATKYSDDLSVNVKRGNRQALLSGRWPGYPKLGYKRDPNTMLLVADDDRFQAIERIFSEVRAGTPPLTVFARAVRDWGLKTPPHRHQGNRPLTRSAFYRLLRDEFYTGVMIRAGVRYPGTHPPAVSVADWTTIQELLDGRVQRRPRPKQNFFPYRGHVLCGTCGSLATARTVVNRWGSSYRYYHCYRKERRYRFCPEPAVAESAIEAELCRFFEELWLPPTWLEALLDLLDELANAAEGTITNEREKHDARLVPWN